jgi:hypothetical protein
MMLSVKKVQRPAFIAHGFHKVEYTVDMLVIPASIYWRDICTRRPSPHSELLSLAQLLVKFNNIWNKVVTSHHSMRCGRKYRYAKHEWGAGKY